ncbi:MAG: HAD-IB family hydrolase [Panacagrimonas sp.]
MSTLEEALAAIEAAPRGPKIGAFFDFDGTLIDGYSALAYFQDRMRRGEVGVAELVETIKLMRRGELSEDEFRDVITDAMVAWSDRSVDEIRAMWKRLYQQKIARTQFPEGWALVQAHLRMGHTVSVASSATPFQIEPLAEEYGIQHILATQPRTRNGRITGGLKGKPLWGSGKANAVRAFAREHGIALDKSFGYANGNEDIDFLSTVGKPKAVQPGEKLLAHAEAHRWPVLRFKARRKAGREALARSVAAYTAMGGTLLAGIGMAKATGDNRRAVDFMTGVSADTTMKILGVTVDVQGEEHLWSSRPCVFIINHQSKFDMFLTGYLLRSGITAIAKKEAADAFGFGAFLKMADVAFIDRSNTAKALEAMKPVTDRLKRGLCVCVSPEGTRSYSPKLGPFKKGAFHMAQQAGVPIVPIVIRNAGEIMGRDDHVMRSGICQVVVHPPIDVSGWGRSEMTEKVEDVRQLYLDTLANWPGGEKS